MYCVRRFRTDRTLTKNNSSDSSTSVSEDECEKHQDSKIIHKNGTVDKLQDENLA